MRIQSTYIYIVLLSLALLTGCRQKKQDEKPAESVNEEQLMRDFIQQMENAVAQGLPDYINDAIDTNVLKAKAAEVSDAVEMGMGPKIFEGNCSYGDMFVEIVKNGGDVRFDTCYVQEGIHHLVARTYDAYGNLQFHDFQILFKKNKPMITDAFLYDFSSMLSQKIGHEASLNAFLNLPEPKEPAITMKSLMDAFDEGNYKQMLSLLREKKELLSSYPVYNKFFTIALFESSEDFVGEMEKFQAEGADPRFVLLQELNYYTAKGIPQGAFQAINQLIDYTGDDPVYWLMYARTLAEAGQYQDALDAYNTAKQGFQNYIWDIWTGELSCYYHLNEKERFNSCLNAGKELYGMQDSELKSLVQNHYPKFK